MCVWAGDRVCTALGQRHRHSHRATPLLLPALQVEGGDRIRILTPGGGGYGPPPERSEGAGGGSDGGADAAAAERGVAARQARVGAAREASAPVREGGSVAEFQRSQESV